MAPVKLLTDVEVEVKPAVEAVFDDIRATRKSDFINNFWRGLANDPALLKRTWEGVKAIMMVEGALDPAAARARGMTDAQHAELISVIGLAGQTNHLVTAMQIPVDAEFEA
jgi:alkylhydroperoxidase family enzyme